MIVNKMRGQFSLSVEILYLLFVPPQARFLDLCVRTPFRVFLDFMESSLSQDSIHMPVKGSR